MPSASNVVPKKVRSPFKDKEIQTQDHDKLLLWLVENLQAIATHVFTPEHEQLQRDAAQAELRLRSEMADLIASLDKKAADVALPAPLRDACRGKAVEARAFMQKLVIPRLEEPVAGEVGDHVIQKEVLGPRRSYTGKQKQVGFIDLAATVKVVTSVSLSSCLGAMPYEVEEEGARTDTPGARATRDMHTVKAMQFHPPFWMATGVSRPVWFDVRLSLPSVGSLLQDLKILRTFASVTYIDLDTQVVVVTADQVAPAVQEAIWNEGFYVVSKHEYENA